MLANLASVYWTQGRLGIAEQLSSRALAIREASPVPSKEDVAHSLRVLALVLTDQGRYDDAEPLVKRAIILEEAVSGAGHPNMLSHLNGLADIYRLKGRYPEAEALYRRALTIAEQSGNELLVSAIRNNLAWLNWSRGRLDEAERLYKSSLEIAERKLAADHPTHLTLLHNLAALYRLQDRFVESEDVLKRAIAIGEATGAIHPHFAKAMNNLALVYQRQRRLSEAGELFQRAIVVANRALGPEHSDSASYLSNLGALHAAKGEWSRAADLLRRGTSVEVARVRRTAGALGRPPTGALAVEAARPGEKLTLLVKTLARITPDSRDSGATAEEMFLAAQRARLSEAAASLSQMAARHAKGNPDLEHIVRERQDLASEWQSRDKLLLSAVSQPPEKRHFAAEKSLAARMEAIERRIMEIDRTIAAEFVEYSALANPEPASLGEVQAQLRPHEALIVTLDTPAFDPMPEETFVWLVTKTDMRFVRSDLGTPALTREVAALRCGLDNSAWNDADSSDKCVEMVKKYRYDASIDGQFVKVLPFDLERAHALYKALFGQIEDLLKDKHVVIVPSGPLTSLPLHVLVTEPPKTRIPATIAEYREVAWLATRQAITVLPSAASLKTLRQVAKIGDAKRSYLGIGNPLLDGRQDDPQRGEYYKAQAQAARDKHCSGPLKLQVAAARGRRAISGLRELLRGGRVDIEDIRREEPLPESADELCEIGLRLGAPVSDILLGGSATEFRTQGPLRER